MVFQIVQGGHGKFAKVKIGIVHLFANSTKIYTRKTWRRIRDYLYYRGLGERSYPWEVINRNGLKKFIIATLLPAFLANDIVKGYRRKPDIAWLFHAAANWITLFTYSSAYITSALHSSNPSSAPGVER